MMQQLEVESSRRQKVISTEPVAPKAHKDERDGGPRRQALLETIKALLNSCNSFSVAFTAYAKD